MADRTSSAALTCTYCGLLDWTVRKYGRVTHKQSCPHRTDPWHQGDPKASAARTTYRVASFIETGPPRWGTRKLWRVDAGSPYYREVAGPFTSRREALDALAELVNEAYGVVVPLWLTVYVWGRKWR